MELQVAEMNHVIWHWKDEYHLDDSIDSQGNSRSSISRDVVWFSPEPQHQKTSHNANTDSDEASIRFEDANGDDVEVTEEFLAFMALSRILRWQQKREEEEQLKRSEEESANRERLCREVAVMDEKRHLGKYYETYCRLRAETNA
eukprot:gene1760-4873_t